MTKKKEYLDANTEAASDGKSMREVVNHVGQQIQPATSLHITDFRIILYWLIILINDYFYGYRTNWVDLITLHKALKTTSESCKS